MMLRKRLAIVFLAVAQIVILGHNMVSHHHHTDTFYEGQLHHSKSGNSQHVDETPLALAFANFLHAGEQLTFIHAEATTLAVSKEAVHFIKALPVAFKAPVNTMVAYQKHTFPPSSQPSYTSPQNRVHKLRGPPTFIVA